ncbi:MAG TPA: hypothetical protein VHN16_17155 [Streptosporangiaceae bacterium]|jgi:hypothetical protein|nr:hypothetical protein [Streptosporangiaceae bacterium]
MSLDADQLFALLPAVYRTRDAVNGGQLQALFAVMAAQSGIVDDNIQQLYDDQFIETCAPWVIPYIGDLIGYNSIYEIASASSDSRAEVAHTIGYRRRKGTHLALEQLSMDISGRAIVVVEEFSRLITTESMRHVRPRHDATVNLRRGRALDHLGTAFDVSNRTVDVRRIAPRVRTIPDPDTAPLDIALHGPGRFNIPDIAIHMWRWQSWKVTDAPAFVVGGGRYMFSPLGNNTPLFSNPPMRNAFTSLATRLDVPQPIGRRELPGFYGPTGSILLTADGTPVDVGQIYGANLSDRPGGSWCTVASGKIAIDPELGRIQYADDVPLPQCLQLSYLYGFPAGIAGGPYDRTLSLSQLNPAAAGFFAVVGSAAFPTLESAVTGWNQLAAGSSGIIVLPGFESLTIDLTGAPAVRLPAGSSLSIVAAEPVTAGAPREVIWNSSRVTLTGDIEVTGVAGLPTSSGDPAPAGQLLISGAWMAGQLSVTGDTGASSTIQLADSTLVPGLGLLRDGDPLLPGDPSIIITAPGTSLVLNRVISGPIAAHATGTTRICASVIDATSPCYVAYAGPDLASAGADLHVEDSTIIGKVRTRTMTLASNTIFHARRGRRDPWQAAVWASRRQAGCVRFCLLPFDSITPRRYNCLPADAASEAALAPSFVTQRYGNPAYALLSGDTPMAIWTGADNGSQLGVYLQIQETEAVSNVQLRAPEYLPALLESGIFLHPSHPQREHRPAPIGYGYGHPRHDDVADLPGDLANLGGDPVYLPGIGAGLI